ncbi:MAG TPA: hypothetical protein PLC84_08090 [Methanosarcina thermophila]|nr:hypothetical protein [Methanosarcina thermophila]
MPTSLFKKLLERKLFRKKFDQKPFEKRFFENGVTAWSSDATFGNLPAQRSQYNGLGNDFT